MRVLRLLLLVAYIQEARAGESLCVANEAVVFSCHIAEKIVSLCRPLGLASALIYRHGTPGHPDMVYPDPGSQEKGTFYRSSTPLFGGGRTTVSFTRGPDEYQIYSAVGRADSSTSPSERTPIFEDGTAVSHNGERAKQLVCDDGGDGFREDIGWIPER